MWSWIDTASQLIVQYPTWALTAAFAAAIIEAVAIVGTVIPGTFNLMGIAGAAAAAGQPMLPFLILAFIGAIIGDYISYWVGFRYRATLRHSWPFASRPQIIARADSFFERYGTYSVALCRFIPVLRSTVPLAAGLSGMEQRRFLIANVSSAAVWAVSHVYPAAFAGMTIERLRMGDWETASLWAGALVLSSALIWVVHRRAVARSRSR